MKNTVVQPGGSQLRNLVACLSQAGRVCFSQCNTEARVFYWEVKDRSWSARTPGILRVKPKVRPSSLDQVILRGMKILSTIKKKCCSCLQPSLIVTLSVGATDH